MLLGMETFSYHLAFQARKMDVFDFIRRCAELGLDGVQLNAEGPGPGHLGSHDIGHLQAIRNMTRDLGLFVEVDTQGTDPKHLATMLSICDGVGADVLRTFASCGGDLVQELTQAPQHLREVVPMCADLGIHIALENHEYETAEDVLKGVRQVDSEWVGTHVDIGNSMMVWEEPVAAVAALAPYAVSSHFKDHVVIVEDEEPLVVGVAVGTGSIDCAECFRILAEESPLERIIIEVCYAYSAPFRRPQQQGAGGQLGEGAFRVAEGPFDPSWIPPTVSQVSDSHQWWLSLDDYLASPEGKSMIQWEHEAMVESVAFVKKLNEAYQ